MLVVREALTFEDGMPERKPKIALAMALVATFFLWTGCSGISASSPASNTQTAPSSQTALPNAYVGNSYHGALFASGSPHPFVLSSGELPPGLALDAVTGGISGTPTQAGAFTFAVVGQSSPTRVGGREEGSSVGGGNVYAIRVLEKPVTLQISPSGAFVAAGGKLQFTAAVSNTSNTSVIWSTTAGNISSSGLFTAPTSGTTNSITVTASSKVQGTALANTVVTVVSSQFAILTSGMPPAVTSTPYSTLLTATGGQAPYRWSIALGSLPSGLTLDATTGTLSGVATKAGAFAFSVKGTDANSESAQRNYSLVVSSSGQICGPPAYQCSRTDQEIVQLPSITPNVGTLTGANTIVTDPNFGNRIVRITDANTNPATGFENRSYVSSASGSADDNLWNVDSTLFVVQDTGANSYPFTFNPSTLQASRMYVSSFPSTNGLKLGVSGDWSRVDANVLYASSGTAILKYDFTDRSNPPSPQTFYDFSSSGNCLPAGFTATWSTRGGLSGDDTVFGMAYSNTGSQDTGVYAVAYKVGSGCSILNTQTGQVGGDWGAKGTINISDRWTIHNAKLSKDGNWLIIDNETCTSSNCMAGPYFWQIGTTNVGACGQGPHCTGHWTEGYSHWINNNQVGNQESRSLSDPAAAIDLTPVLTIPSQTTLDEHASWNNADPADDLPFAVSFWSPVTPFPAAWYNEITAVAPDGSGKVWRFAHSFITAKSQVFNAYYGIGSVSQDGRFFLLSSDWMGTLGSESGTSSCTVGTDCRGDAFVIELN